MASNFSIYGWASKDKSITYPTKWVQPTGGSKLKVVAGGKRVFNPVTTEAEFAVQTDKPIDTSKNASYYFEVTVAKLGENACLAVGFVSEGFEQTSKLPGWVKGSFAYHSDDGSFFNGKGTAADDKFGPVVRAGNVVGCGYDKDGNLFFTLNGTKLKETKAKLKGQYYPAVGFDCSAEIVANFGDRAFAYQTEEWAKFKLGKELAKQFDWPERYVARLSTDKPIYRPGDDLYFRAVLLNAHDQTPLPHHMAQQLFPLWGAQVVIKEPSGSEAFKQDLGPPISSIISGTWKIPAEKQGGDYTLHLKFWNEGFPAVERKFNIRNFSTPRLKLQLEFPKKGYGPGDEVTANLSVERAEGGVPEKAVVTSVARIDGAEAFREKGTLDSNGKLTVKFTLPTEIAMGEGTLNCTVDDNGTIESTGQTIPILLQNIDMTFYPEGGELVAGLPSRVYLEAFTPTGDPADLSGEIVDEMNVPVGFLQTMHEGRGRGSFTPMLGKSYTLRVRNPTGIKVQNPLPDVVEEGVSIVAHKEVYNAGDPLGFKIGAIVPGYYHVACFKRDAEVASRDFEISFIGEVLDVELSVPKTGVADGVLRVTVFDAAGTPKAERLVFSTEMQIVVQANRDTYAPGDPVELTIDTFNEKGEPIEGTVGVCVTDDSVLEMVEKRKQVPRLPVQVFLEDEVDHLDDAHVYLDKTHPKSDIALDLLLGTQGWRRFAFVDPATFIANTKDEVATEKLPRAKSEAAAERLLAVHKGTTPPPPKVTAPAPVFQAQNLRLENEGFRDFGGQRKGKGKGKARRNFGGLNFNKKAMAKPQAAREKVAMPAAAPMPAPKAAKPAPKAAKMAKAEHRMARQKMAPMKKKKRAKHAPVNRVF